MSSALSSVGVVAGAGVFCVFAGGALTGIFTLGTFGLNRAVKGLTSHADVPEHLRYYRAHQEPATGLYAPMGHAYEPRTIG